MTVRRTWLAVALILYLALAGYQLELPGLHYDEAKEAGVNAMQLLTGAPVTAFRDAGVSVGGRTWPLMVQDYIGALNVYLALPLLALTGIGVPNLRLLPLLCGLLALLLLERAISAWCASLRRPDLDPAPDSLDTPISLAGLFAVSLLAISPSYVFWARQGIFVTNLMLPFVFLCLWQGVRWLRGGQSRALVMAALGGGLALYAKLSAYWVIVPFVLLAGGWWLWARLRRSPAAPALGWRTATAALAAFVLPLLPLLAFNWQTGGTWTSIGGNLGRSYYGVENGDIAANLLVRWAQVGQVLRGDQFWYLGGVFANPLAPWLAALLILAGLWRSWRSVLPPLLLAAGAFVASLFTVSDLFVTHYVLLQPLLVAVAALGAAALWETRATLRPLLRPVAAAGAAAALILWLAFDLAAGLHYHQALARSGGLAGHSDASYHLAYHLQYNGMGSPLALDWGIDAPVRFLTRGAVTPIEIFGYTSLAAPDAQYLADLVPFLSNLDNRYLLHAPAATVFAGRREAFFAVVQSQGLHAALEQVFSQRDGAPLYELWRVYAQ